MTDPAWRQGAEIALTITDLNDQGDGVGRWQERVVFVPNTVPGDQVRVRLVWVKPSYAYGTLLGLDAPSPIAWCPCVRLPIPVAAVSGSTLTIAISLWPSSGRSSRPSSALAVWPIPRRSCAIPAATLGLPQQSHLPAGAESSR